jgi:predicted Co/Zn/Cd cation transporter (cation efflux family)
METTTVSKNTVSFGLSLAIACIVNAIIVCVKEKSEPVMNGMKKLTGHHWITHTVIVLVVFVVFALIFGRMNGGQGMKLTIGGLIRTIVGGVVLAGLIITGFYLFAD